MSGNHSKPKRKMENRKTEKSKMTRKKSNHKVLKRSFLILGIILFLILGIFTYKVYKNGWGIQGLLSTMLGQNAQTLEDLDTIDFLAIGESGNMTDTIIICSYNPKEQTATMLSVPRDTFIGDNKSNASTSHKINCVYNIKKDPMETVKAVNKVTGLNLKYYVFVDTKALISLVDAIGGVEFDVPINMDYDDDSKQNNLHIHLKKGMQTIDGNKAEQLLRFRHNNNGTSYPTEYGDNDLGRMKTQREFIKATINQTLKANNIFKLTEILEIANKYTKTNLPIDTVKAYIPYAVSFNTENITSEMLPNTTATLNEISFVLLKEDEVEKMINDKFFGGTKDVQEGEQKPVTVELLNGSGNPELLEKALNKLESSNFDVVKVGNASSYKTTNVLNRTKQSNDIISKVDSLLNVKSKNSSAKDNIDCDLTIIIGKDYE